MITDLNGKTAVITGAASGIGRGLAVRCAEEGMRVVASDVERGALDETVALAGGDAIGVVADVSDAASVDALADAAFDAFGEVHLLCNNAGVFQAGILWERTLADWEWVLGVNVWGIIHGIRSFLPRMIAQGGVGHVVNTSSLAGIVTGAYSGPYVTSKFAALGLTESLAHDLAAAGSSIGASRAGAGGGEHPHQRVGPQPSRGTGRRHGRRGPRVRRGLPDQGRVERARAVRDRRSGAGRRPHGPVRDPDERRLRRPGSRPGGGDARAPPAHGPRVQLTPTSERPSTLSIIRRVKFGASAVIVANSVWWLTSMIASVVATTVAERGDG